MGGRMTGRLVVALVIAWSSGCGGHTSAGVTTHTFHSAALDREMTYRIFMPTSSATAPVPVVYLLHGYGGDAADWFTHSRAAELADRLGLAVVTPDGGDSWYVNSPSGRWADYIVTDLVREVEGRFAVRRSRQGRVVAGLSMGGFGAMNLAMRHPDVFAIAASMSGALDTMRATSVFAPEAAQPELAARLGPANGPTRRDNDVYQLAATVPVTALPYLYLDCGASDPWIGINREFAQLLAARGIAHEFHEAPGDHDFHYWDRQIEVVLTLAAKRLR